MKMAAEAGNLFVKPARKNVLKSGQWTFWENMVVLKRIQCVNGSLIWRGEVYFPHFHRKVLAKYVRMKKHQLHHDICLYSQPFTNGLLTQVGNDYVCVRVNCDHDIWSPVYLE